MNHGLSIGVLDIALRRLRKGIWQSKPILLAGMMLHMDTRMSFQVMLRKG